MKLYLILISMYMLGLSGCSRDVPTLMFVLPDQFNGLLLVTEDKQAGADMQLVNGQYTLNVPSSGKLAVKNLEPFTEWHKLVGKYKNGTIIPGDAVNSATGYAIWSIPSIPGHGYYFFVGTLQEYDLVSRGEPEKLPLATKIDAAMLNKS